MLPLLEALTHLVQEVNAAPDLDRALRIIVARVREILKVDVCSVYLTSEDTPRRHVLMMSDGLFSEAVGRLQVRDGEGLVGLVAERAGPVNLADAPDHPCKVCVDEAGKVAFHAFLGVPVIHRGQVIGVVVVRHREARRFEEADVAFLVTLSAQLAAAIAYAKAAGGADGIDAARDRTRRYFAGRPAAPGVGIGTGVVIAPEAQLSAVADAPTEDPAREEGALRLAVTEVAEEMTDLAQRLSGALPAEDRTLFDAYAAMATSDELLEEAVARIDSGSWAPGALRDTIESLAARFEAMEDAYLRERAADVRDLGGRILTHLFRQRDSDIEYPERTILAGEQLSAMDVAEVPPGRLAGVICGCGSPLSHAAILARALGVPAVMGTGDLPLHRLHERELVVDGYRGRVYLEPSPPLRAEYVRLADQERAFSAELRGLHDLPAQTRDEVRVPLYTNASLLADVNATLDVGAEGVGLYRTELPFMLRERFPTEQEQRNIYRQVLDVRAPRPVTVRTLDAGGDKTLPYFKVKEANPALGWRGIRMTLDQPEMLLAQFRAALAADAARGSLRLLLPMVQSPAELAAASVLLDRAVDDLRREGAEVLRPPLGVMVEVPAAVFQARELAAAADFLSVGTNDLTQYLLAADRTNPRVAKLLDPLHPAVLRALVQVADAAREAGTPVGVCGEMGGDPAAVPLLLAMGMDHLSVNVGDLPRIKWVIRHLTMALCRELLHRALERTTAQEIRSLMERALVEAGLGRLLREGNGD
jgi:phosphotransferase system enzyme I (PtsP)